MDLRDPVVLQGLAATGGAMLVVAALAWWLYLSPATERTPVVPTPLRLAQGLALALGLAGLQMLAGGLWDASQHIRTGLIVGGADFLWPSHIVLYSSFLFSLAASAVAMGRLSGEARAAGLNDVRLWFRRRPLVGIVALASAYELFALPGDALWHEVFGIDLTAWSPPHLTISLMMGAVLLAAAAMLVDAHESARASRTVVPAVLLSGLALNVLYLIGVLEWELPVPLTALVAERPIWAYPAVSAVLAFAVLSLARRLVPARWTATGAALAFVAIRLAVTSGLAVTDQVAPIVSLVPLLGAVALDLTARRGAVASAVAFTIGYYAVAIPQLGLRTDLPRITAADHIVAVAITLAASIALLGMLSLRARRRIRNAAQAAPATSVTY